MARRARDEDRGFGETARERVRGIMMLWGIDVGELTWRGCWVTEAGCRGSDSSGSGTSCCG